ncbi:MAG: DinB family protein [Acidimicrobiales bacterium]
MDDTSTSTPTPTPTSTSTGERRDLLEALAAHRGFLLRTADGLSDEQARTRSTVSTLTIGGIIKHVAATEAWWSEFMVSGAQGGGDPEVDWSDPPPEVVEAYEAGFRLLDDETLEGSLAEYARVAAHTDELVATLDLDRSFLLPPAPWFPPGAQRSVRRTIVHIIAETAQHAGHADIIREAIDGARTMG